MTPLTASADHQRHDIVEVLAGAAVAYLIIDSLDDDNRHYRRHKDRYAHDRHYKGRYHAKHKRQHKRYGYKDRSHNRYYR